MSNLPGYMRPEQPRGEIPQFNVGEQVEVNVQQIQETTGKFGKQLQIDGTIPSRNDWRARAWIKYYPVPAPNQYLGKLCLAIERVTGQTFSSLDAAIGALKSYGRMYFRVTGSNRVTGDDGETRVYPKFAVVAEVLPGEQTGAQYEQAGLPHPALQNDLSNQTKIFLEVNQQVIGNKIADKLYNLLTNQGIIQELNKLGLIEWKDQEPYLSERARKYI